jgi:hypothetical protein
MLISCTIWLKREQQEEYTFLLLGHQLRLRPDRLTGVIVLLGRPPQPADPDCAHIDKQDKNNG